jgi:hypothetical protein
LFQDTFYSNAEYYVSVQHVIVPSYVLGLFRTISNT